MGESWRRAMGVASGAGAPVRKVVGSRFEVSRIHRTTAKVVREFRHVDGGGNQRAAIFHRRKARKRTEIRKRKSLRVNSRIRARRFEFEFDREGGSELGVGRGAVARIFGEDCRPRGVEEEIVTESFVSRDGVCVVVDRANDRVEMVVRVCVVSFSGFRFDERE